jgi:hypothetical protein
LVWLAPAAAAGYRIGERNGTVRMEAKMENKDFSNGVEFEQYLHQEGVKLCWIWFPEDEENPEEIILEHCYNNETLEDLSEDQVQSIMDKYGDDLMKLIESSLDQMFEESEDPELQEEDEWAELDAIKPLGYKED